MFKPEDSLYFLHIPKTAGTSLVNWLALRFSSSESFLYLNSPEQLASATSQSSTTGRLFSGHLGLEALGNLPGKPHVITWLRQPARRLLSSYHYLRKLDAVSQQFMHDPHAQAQQEAAQRLSFDEWVRLPQEGYFHHDLLAQTLAGPHAWGDQVLPAALHNLWALSHVGLVERMQDSVDLLCYEFGWLPSVFDLRLNVSVITERDSIAPDTLRVIRERNALDYAIYSEAVSLFEGRWQAMFHTLGIKPAVVFFRRELEALVDAPAPLVSSTTDQGVIHARIEDRFRLTHAGLTAPATGTFSFAEVIAGRGWSAPVPAEKPNGMIVRWSGPRPTSDLFLNLPKDTDLQVEFTVQSIMHYRVIESLSLCVNDAPVSLMSAMMGQSDDAVPCRFRGVISATLLASQPGLTKFTFTISQTYAEPVPSEPELGPKLLGFSLDGITFTPVPPDVSAPPQIPAEEIAGSRFT